MWRTGGPYPYFPDHYPLHCIEIDERVGHDAVEGVAPAIRKAGARD